MKREENETMRLCILDAVIACKIDANGAEVSLSQIASRTGISERTLNRYFPDKEMLFYEASIRYLKQLYIAFADQYAALDKTGLDGLQRLVLLIQLQIEHNRNNMDNATVFVRAYTTALRTAVYRNLPVSNYDIPIKNIICQCIEAGIADGSVSKKIIPSDAYLLITSNYIGLVQKLIYIYSVEFSREEHKKEILLVFNEYLEMLEKYLRRE